MLKFILGFLLLLVLLLLVNIGNIRKLRFAITLFNEDKIVENFLNLEKKFPHNKLEKSTTPYHLPKERSHQLLESFIWEGKAVDVATYLDYSRTTGFIITHKGTIIYEQYHRGMEEGTTHISWSLAKSFVSALVGSAYEEGLIKSLEEPVTKYLPELKSSGYDGVLIKDVLQMSSGIRFTEDYRDFNSDINRFGRSFALGSSLEKFTKSLKRERKPGNYNQYVSIDTQVLGMLVIKVTGKSLSAYLQEKIWEPLGMEYDAQWIVDRKGVEAAFGGLNVALRDYAKFGLLYLNEGNWNGLQVISKEWVQQSLTPDAPHLQPGADNPLSDNVFGYGYQWWVPEKPDNDFFASGIYNQYIYGNKGKDLLIVKTSANHHFKEPDDDSKAKHIAMFQAMAKQF